MMQQIPVPTPRPAGLPELRSRATALLLGLGLALAWLPQAHADMFPDNEARRAILDLRGQIAQNQRFRPAPGLAADRAHQSGNPGALKPSAIITPG